VTNSHDYPIEHGPYAAVITEVGASLRSLTHAGRALSAEFDVAEVRPDYCGAVLAPWPNRIADGRYAFNGDHHQLAVTEPARGNAVHGLVALVRFDLVEHTADRVVLAHRLVPQPGYPYPLEIAVTYQLDGAGLHWRVDTTNLGDRPAPYGCAPHPYLRAGAAPLSEWTLELPATEYLRVTADRLLPAGISGVGGTALDFRAPRKIGSVALDHAFTGIKPGDDGLARVRALAPDGRGVECTWDPAVSPWVQVFSADQPEQQVSRSGLAIEPMTCPPDAFNSGVDLVVLAPGQNHHVEWTIAAV
jgi:aldose 1-epimerase